MSILKEYIEEKYAKDLIRDFFNKDQFWNATPRDRNGWLLDYFKNVNGFKSQLQIDEIEAIAKYAYEVGLYVGGKK